MSKSKELAAQIAREKGVPFATLQAILVKMGEAGVKDEDIQKLLDAKADELIKLRAQIEQFRKGTPDLGAIAEKAQQLIDKGELDEASRVLADGRRAARTQRENDSRDEANLTALDARVDDLKLAYRSAASKYGEAAGLVAGFDPGKQFKLLGEQEDELYKQGDEFGDNSALGEAIEVARRMQSVARDADQRGAALNWLGNALQTLGERESGTARLEEAVAACRAALEEYTRERVPLQWAATQNNLGNALRILGERESGTARLAEAVAGFRAALQERTRERVPLDWAHTQANLRAALTRLGERESGTARLDEAVAAYRAALEEYRRERVPLLWATTQVNLGNALRTLGERENGTARLEEAVAAHRAALEEYRRERVPLLWATTQANLGAALTRLGERESGTARLDEAVAAYRAALEEYRRERVPLLWAMTQVNLGAALTRLANAKAARRALMRQSPPTAPPWRNIDASASRSCGPRPRPISALRSKRSANARAARRGWRRPSPPIARHCRNERARASRSIGP